MLAGNGNDMALGVDGADADLPVNPSGPFQDAAVYQARVIGGGDKTAALRVAGRVHAVKKGENAGVRAVEGVQLLGNQQRWPGISGDDSGNLKGGVAGGIDDAYLLVNRIGKRLKDGGLAGAGRPGEQQLAQTGLVVACVKMGLVPERFTGQFPNSLSFRLARRPPPASTEQLCVHQGEVFIGVQAAKR